MAPKYGGIVSIQTPPLTDYVDPSEIALQRQVSEGPRLSGHSVAASGLIQTGIYRSGTDNSLDLCSPAVNTYRHYMEYKPQLGAPGYGGGFQGFYCALYGSPGPGDQAPFYSWHTYSPSAGTWHGGIGYFDLGGYQLGFTSAAIGIGGELNSPGQSNGSNVHARYGDTTSWQLFMHSERGSPEQVLNPSNIVPGQPSTGWDASRRAPTPLSIRHGP